MDLIFPFHFRSPLRLRLFLFGNVSSNVSCCFPLRTIFPSFNSLLAHILRPILLPGPSWFASHPTQANSSPTFELWHAIIVSVDKLMTPGFAIVDFKAACFFSQYPLGMSCGSASFRHGHVLHCLSDFISISESHLDFASPKRARLLVDVKNSSPCFHPIVDAKHDRDRVLDRFDRSPKITVIQSTAADPGHDDRR